MATSAPTRYFAAFPLGPVVGADAPAPALLEELGIDLQPGDALEALIIARLIQAGAQIGALHAADTRNATWLRELTLAERVFWAAMTALQRHRRPARAPSDRKEPGGARPSLGLGLGFGYPPPPAPPRTAPPTRSRPTAPTPEPAPAEPPRLALGVTSEEPTDAVQAAAHEPVSDADTAAPSVTSDAPPTAPEDPPVAPAAPDHPPAPAEAPPTPDDPPVLVAVPPILLDESPMPLAETPASLDDPPTSMQAAGSCASHDAPDESNADPPTPPATDWRPHVVIDPDISPIWPVLRGTRAYVEEIAAAIEDGWSDATLLDHVPGLTPELLAVAKACEAEAMSGPWLGGVPTPQPRISDQLANPPPGPE